jgi:ribosomal protein L14
MYVMNTCAQLRFIQLLPSP